MCDENLGKEYCGQVVCQQPQRVSWHQDVGVHHWCGVWDPGTGEYLKILCVKMDFGVRGPHSARWGPLTSTRNWPSSGTDVLALQQCTVSRCQFSRCDFICKCCSRPGNLELLSPVLVVDFRRYVPAEADLCGLCDSPEGSVAWHKFVVRTEARS